MLLYDKMMEEIKKHGDRHDLSEDAQLRIVWLEESVVIVANNVCSYIYEISTQDEWNIHHDFPNVAPPFETFFIEFNAPRTINVNGNILTDHKFRDYKFGILFKAFDTGNHYLSSIGARWAIGCTVYQRSESMNKTVIVGYAQIAVREDGTVIDSDPGYIVAIPKEQNGKDPDAIQRAIHNTLIVGLMTISLMHCKNVDLKTQIPPVALSKKHQKRCGVPLVKYKILEIDPMKKILRLEGNSQSLGLKHALHICRGHFKDFSKGKGLFGRYRGMYWWDSHVRGDPSHGVVVKDYNVNPKEDDNDQR